MGGRGNLRKARFYSVLCAEENHRAETGGGVAAAVAVQEGMVSPDMGKKARPLDRRDAISFLQFAGLRLIGPSFQKGDMPRLTCVILITWAACAGWAHVPWASFLPPPETSDDAFDLAQVHIRYG